MKCLFIRQPWAWLIVNGHKPIENRDWDTCFRGEFLIGASKPLTHDEWADGLNTALDALGTDVDELAMPSRKTMLATMCGGIVGRATLTGCVIASPSPWFFGRYGFVLEHASPLPFRPLKGQLGFFDVPDILGESR